jgi:hypothetical protein
MDWEDKLISLYVVISNEYHEIIYPHVEIFTNGKNISFSDEEVMTIYCCGILRGYRTITAMHRYAQDHLRDYFPKLPEYAAFIHRVNKLSSGFIALISFLQAKKVPEYDESVYLIDSFPITLAKSNYAYTAKVAPELASKSYNSTKKMYYYGVKAHVVARKREATLPDIEIIFIEEAGRQDGPFFDQIRPMLTENLLFGDQAYKMTDEKKVELIQGLKVLKPVKKQRGKKHLSPEDKNYSNAVSRMRQPIEALLGWLNKVTGIGDASNVRSSTGLLTHIYGRLAAAMMLRSYPELGF